MGIPGAGLRACFPSPKAGEAKTGTRHLLREQPGPSPGAPPCLGIVAIRLRLLSINSGGDEERRRGYCQLMVETDS